MKLGLVTDCLADRSLEEAAAVCRRLGLEQVELGCGNWSPAPHVDLEKLTADAGARHRLLDTLAACTGIVSPGWVAEMAVAIETVRIGGYTLVTILGALGGVIECLGLVFILLLYLEDAAGSRIPRIAGALSKLKRWDFNEEQV